MTSWPRLAIAAAMLAPSFPSPTTEKRLLIGYVAEVGKEKSDQWKSLLKFRQLEPIEFDAVAPEIAAPVQPERRAEQCLHLLIIVPLGPWGSRTVGHFTELGPI